jgi:hypothetical protein
MADRWIDQPLRRPETQLKYLRIVCACALHEFRGRTVCGVGAEGFASFPCQTDRGLEEQRQGGPYTCEKSSLAREGSNLSSKNLPGQLERGVGDGESFVIGRNDGTVVSDQGR